jgi:hypothetical protein
MTEPPARPRVTSKTSPLAVIVVVILVGIVIVALVKQRGHHVTPSGVKVPMAASTAAAPPQPTDLPNTVAPSANSNDGPEAANAQGSR